MSTFVERKATKKSMALRKQILGVGINDAPYMACQTIDGKRDRCPFYRCWMSMLRRCNSEKYQKERPTYIGCNVCEEWLTFTNFRRWMIQQDWQGKQIDKDIILPRNKIYSPQTCCFVNRALNQLLTDSAAGRGDFPMGVSKRYKRFAAVISINGKSKHLGIFDTPEAASSAYRNAKARHLVDTAIQQNDSRIAAGLIKHAALRKYGVCEAWSEYAVAV